MPTDKENDYGVARAAAVLADSRERFVVTMAALEGEIMHTLDWRAWMRPRLPWAMVVAFGVGLYLGRKR